MADEEKTEEGEGKKAKSPVLLIIIAAVVALVLGGGGVAAYFMFMGDPAPAEGAAAEPVAKQEAIYTKIRTLEGKPMFVVSLEAMDGRPHYMQLYVESKSRDAAVDEALQLHMPLIVARLNTLFSSQNFDDLIKIDGKRAMQKQALEIVQGIMQEKIGQPGIEKILFTNMVMQ